LQHRCGLIGADFSFRALEKNRRLAAGYVFRRLDVERQHVGRKAGLFGKARRAHLSPDRHEPRVGHTQTRADRRLLDVDDANGLQSLCILGCTRECL